jgi:hypothetical protein
MLLTALVAAAMPVGAGAAVEPIRFTEPAAGQRLAAGHVVDVSWSALPKGVDEFELLLRIGDDPRASVRLTPVLAEGQRAYRWEIPNLPATSARLVLRGDLDDAEELELATSDAFRIVGDALAPVLEVAFRDGELWADPVFASPPIEHPSGSNSERIAPTGEGTLPPAVRRAALSHAAVATGAEAFLSSSTRPRAGFFTSSLLALPRSIPQRN